MLETREDARIETNISDTEVYPFLRYLIHSFLLDSHLKHKILFHLHESKLIDLTKVICTPSRRCDPEHSKQQKEPIRFCVVGASGGDTIKDAQRGERSVQSVHI
jgi:hypothetical protein